MLKKIFSLLLIGGALALPFGLTSGVAQASYTGTDACGLAVHSCDYHSNGSVYTEAIATHSGMHAYNAPVACNFVALNPGSLPPIMGWKVTAGYRAFPYSTDIVSGNTIRVCCGTEASHWSQVETDR